MKPKTFLITGTSGQVGGALMQLLRARKDQTQIFSPSIEELDLSKPDSLTEQLESIHQRTPFQALINCAAYTQVDRAETDRDTCAKINADSPGVIAKFCAQRSIPLVHFSTDYVYPGDGTQPRDETAITGPLSWYGETKLRGDQAVQSSGARHLIFRTSWVYAPEGVNFVLRMIQLAKERKELKIVSDQIGAPSYAPDLARYTLEALDRALEVEQKTGRFPSGVYHLVNAGETSWYEFAQAIFKQLRERDIPLALEQALPIPSEEFPVPARRPKNSRLKLDKLEAAFGIRPREWREALSECMNLALKKKPEETH